MSRKSQRSRTERGTQDNSPAAQPPAESRGGQPWFIALAAVAVMIVAFVLLLSNREEPGPATGTQEARATALASVQSPTLGPAEAKVHVVEFLDPACETCAQFYPIVKQWLAERPDQMRLSVRHVAFHEGADFAVRVLEASRKQDKYWQTLETLLATQSMWAPHHTVQPDLVLQAIAAVGLDQSRLVADMQSAEVEQRIAQDRQDAVTLKVTATPEYFVNGRPLPRFGMQELRDLISEELERND